MYAQIDNDYIIKIYYTKPHWYSSNPSANNESELLTDEELLELNVCPVDINKPSYNEFFYNVIENEYIYWEVDSTNKSVSMTYTINPYEIDEVKENLHRHVDVLKATYEQQGIELSDGNFLLTDDKSIRNLSNAYNHVQKFPSIVYRWKMENGEFELLSKNTIEFMYMSVLKHINYCFEKEYELKKLISEANDITELENIYSNLIF